MSQLRISEPEFLDAVENLQGICILCHEFTGDNEAEPDARKYKCEHCHRDSVYGAEQALLENLIEIV